MAAYSLDEPLPSEVLRSGSTLGYRNYPVFSGPWFWRRTLIFAPIAAGIGVMQAVMIGVGLHDWNVGLVGVAAGIPAWVVIATAGPAFATLVRHRRLSLKIERVCVVLAIALGVMASFVAQYIANKFFATTLTPRYHAALSAAGLPTTRNANPLFTLVLVVWEMAVFLSFGGALALRAYFSEQTRWRDMQHAHELELLRQQKNEADLKLTVLQAQVEPHFLFNTLASVHSLVRQDPERAEATVEALVDHLRATMPKLRAGVGSAHSTLAEQVEVCESYLKVMQIRMGSRLRYSIEVPAPLHCHPFPALMLISLVENAIKHAIEPSPAGGRIVLRAAIEEHDEGRQLAVSVLDDGVGLRPGTGGGVGLENIRAQLATRFESRGSLAIQGRGDGGVEATIRVPCAEPSS